MGLPADPGGHAGPGRAHAVLWPASTISFWRRTRQARSADFILEGAAS